MNKALINFTSIVIIAILAFSVFSPILSMVSGLNDAMVHDDTMIETYTPVEIKMQSSMRTMLEPTDTIVFDNSEAYPMVVQGAVVMIPDSKVSMAPVNIFMIGYILNVVLFIALLVFFVRFIIRVNKGIIFERLNIRLLWRIALCLIAMSVLSIVSGIADMMTVSSLNLTLEGYELGANWTFPWTTLMLGFLSILMAEIWTRGLKLKEDQDLTI